MKVFRFESSRILRKNCLIILLCLLAVSLYFVHQGVMLFEKTKADNELSLKYEESKLKSFVTWDQYGVVGFRMFFEPSPLLVFCRDSAAFTGLESKIDTTEILDIHSPGKGKYLFSKENSLDFAGVIFVLFSLYMIFMGLENFPSKKFIDYALNSKNVLLSIFSRLLLLSGIFALIFLVCYVYATLNGLTFSTSEIQIFIYFSLYSILYLILFYFVGVIISLLFKPKKRVLLALAFWLVAVFLIPELHKIYLTSKSNKMSPPDELNLKKLSTLMDYERGVREEVIKKLKTGGTKEDIKKIYKENVVKYLNQGYALNQQREKDYIKEVAKIVRESETVKPILPFIYFSQIASEASSKGYHSYLDYFDQITKTRDLFIDFYIKNRYENVDKKVISFIRGEENIYKSLSRLPENYFFGLALTALYIIIFLLVSLGLIKKKLKPSFSVTTELPEPVLKGGNSYIMFFYDSQLKENSFSIYSRRQDISCIDQVSITDIDHKISPIKAVKYISAIHGVDRDLVLNYLEKMDVSRQELTTKEKSPQLLRKLYFAIHAAKSDIIVINDFFLNLPREFEKEVLNLFKDLKESGKMFVYMTADMPEFDAETIDSFYTDEVKKTFTLRKFALEKASFR